MLLYVWWWTMHGVVFKFLVGKGLSPSTHASDVFGKFDSMSKSKSSTHILIKRLTRRKYRSSGRWRRSCPSRTCPWCTDSKHARTCFGATRTTTERWAITRETRHRTHDIARKKRNEHKCTWMTKAPAAQNNVLWSTLWWSCSERYNSKCCPGATSTCILWKHVLCAFRPTPTGTARGLAVSTIGRLHVVGQKQRFLPTVWCVFTRHMTWAITPRCCAEPKEAAEGQVTQLRAHTCYITGVMHHMKAEAAVCQLPLAPPPPNLSLFLLRSLCQTCRKELTGKQAAGWLLTHP